MKQEGMGVINRRLLLMKRRLLLMKVIDLSGVTDDNTKEANVVFIFCINEWKLNYHQIYLHSLADCIVMSERRPDVFSLFHYNMGNKTFSLSRVITHVCIIIKYCVLLCANNFR